MSKAENALLAKAHALYSQLLTEENYSIMTAFRSNNELFSYLKSSTAYSKYLNRLPSVRLSRARFENAIRQACLDELASLCRFEKLIGERLYRYFIIKNEIETILYCARHLDTDAITDLFILPEFFKKEQTVFGEDLQKARSFSELSALLSDTPYKRFVDPIASSPVYTGLPILENSLYNYLYICAAEMTEKGFHGQQREEILNYFRFLSDMTMVSTIYRLKTNYSHNENYNSNIFLSDVSSFTDKQKKALIESRDRKDIRAVLSSTPYKKYFRTSSDKPAVQALRTASVKMSFEKLRFSQNPIVCMLSYSTLAENEIKNITHIIEGIKYNLSPEEISEILVI